MNDTLAKIPFHSSYVHDYMYMYMHGDLDIQNAYHQTVIPDTVAKLAIDYCSNDFGDYSCADLATATIFDKSIAI